MRYKDKSHNTFLTEFKKYITPKLREIDMFLKQTNAPFNLESIADVLEIPITEVFEIINEHQLQYINRSAFVLIMKNGSSPICRLFKRELDCGAPKTYLPHEISYIYDIDLDEVLEGYARLGMKSLSCDQLELLFDEIHA